MIPLRNEFTPSSDPLADGTWLSVDDVVSLGRNKRRLLSDITNGKFRSRINGKGRNGKNFYEVALDSLPADLQRRWLANQRLQLAPEQAIEPQSQSPVDLKNEIRLNEALQRLSIKEREAFLTEARRLMGIVKRYVALPLKRERNGIDDIYEFTPAVLALCEEAKCTDETILAYYRSRQHSLRKGTQPRIARAISPRTLDDWSRQVQKDGLLTFLPAPAAVRRSGDKRRAHVSADALQWIDYNLRSCPHARDLFKKLKKQAKKHGWKIPSERWVYRRWKTLPAILTTSMRSKKAYVDKHAPYYPRDNRNLEALQILCGDHSVRDVSVRLPDGSLVRPWLTTWQDVRTGLIWGWHLDLTPSSRTIGLAYANGVKSFGAQPIAQPDEGYYSYIYTDQGKDYRSHSISGKTLTFKRAAAIEGGLAFLCSQNQIEALEESDERHVGLINDLGLKQMLARGYNAREKPVERTHRDISEWEKGTFDVEYCGPNAASKPDAWKEGYARHVRLQKRAKQTGNMPWLDESPFMMIDDYRESLIGYFFEYNHEVHERATLGGIKVVPIEEYKRLYTTRYEISDETLAMLLLKAEPRQISKNGVRLFNLSYLHPDLAYYKDGTTVEVRYSEDDYRRVWIIPPPTDAIPNPHILVADAVIAGGILNPNKETMATVAKQRKHEQKIIREHSLLTHSIIRGESAEDRVAAQLEPEVEEESQVAIAVAGSGGATGPGFAPLPPARVHQFTRLDRKRIGSPAIRPVTVDQVKATAIDESIFEEIETTGGGVKLWEDED